MRISDWRSDVCSSDLRWIRREGRLRKIILNPSLVIVWIFGLMLAFNIDARTQGWFHAKLRLVIILSGYHGWVVGYSKKLAKGLGPSRDKKLRQLNEVQGLLAARIVVLADRKSVGKGKGVSARVCLVGRRLSRIRQLMLAVDIA